MKQSANWSNSQPVRTGDESNSRGPLDQAEQAELLDLARDAIMVRTIDGLIRYWNDGAVKLYGFTKGSAIGADIHTLLKTEFPRPLPEIIDEVCRSGYWAGELRHLTKDRRPVWVHSRWALKVNSDGSRNILELNTDLTELKSSQARLKTELENVRRMNEILIGNEVEINRLRQKLART